MLQSLKILLRQFSRQKLYTFITISCLAIGLTVALLTASYAIYELNYDQFVLTNKKAIYRLKKTYTSGDIQEKLVHIRENIIQQIINTFPEVENVCRLYQAHPGIRYQQRSFKLDHLITADPQLFDFFPVTALHGFLDASLLDPKSIILTESLAKKIAGKTDIIDEVVTLGINFDYKVSAIIQDWPKNSHLQVEAIIPNSKSPFGSVSSTRNKSGDRSITHHYETYLMMSSETNITAFEQELNRTITPIFGKFQSRHSYSLTALEDIYMNAESEGISSRHGDMKKIYLLIVISIVTLIIAGINYVNLTTARATKRASEIGIKKTIGAKRVTLIRQFMFESITITTIATGIAFCLAELLLPTMHKLLLVEFSFFKFYTFPGILYVLLGVLLISVLAGLYPAFYLSHFRPITILQDKTSLNPRSNVINRGLIVVQFVISIVFIIGAIVISKQLTFVNHIDLGYDKEYLLHLNFNLSSKNHDLFRNRLLDNTNIKSVAFTRGVPGQKLLTMNGSLKYMSISSDFIKTFQMELVTGRVPKPGDIDRSCLMNETAFRTLGERSAIGEKFSGKEIIGVVKDFHFASLHTQINPLFMPCSDKHFEDVSLRIDSEQMDLTIQYIRDVWKELYPNMLFDFYFYDEKIDSQYRAEYRLSELINYATIGTILMSCFGLIGLALFASENSTKEIGIRKIFGASVSSVLKLFVTNFIYLVLLANLIAWPIAWYAMKNWLQNFAYRTELQLAFFMISGLLTILIVIVTVAICTLKAAVTNPVETLRYE